jgi:glycosyltransferase involved in cell wall biosynthesis
LALKASIVVPLHNEEGNVDQVVEGLLAALKSLEDYEVILVDDCSSDSTGPLIDEWGRRELRVKTVHRAGSPGFGKALKAGFKAASGEVLIPFMGDLSDHPLDALRLYWKVAREGFDVAVGARWRRGGWAYGMPLPKKLFSIAFSKLSRLLLGTPTSDVTNAFKAYRRPVVESIELEADGFEASAELLIKAFFKGFKIADVPVGWRGRVRGEAKLKALKAGPSYLRLLLKSFLKYRVRGIKPEGPPAPA